MKLFLSILTLLVVSRAVAQMVIIQPVPPTDAKLETEKRIYELEKAVKELQEKVYHPDKPVLNKYFCEISVFSKRYKAFAPTQVEAREKIKEDCAKDGNDFHCQKNIQCSLNE